MRILFVTENGHPWSGSSVQLADLAHGLRQTGHEAFLTVRGRPLNEYQQLLDQSPWAEFDDVVRYRDINLAKYCIAHEVSLVHTHIEVAPFVVHQLQNTRIPIIVNYGSSEAPTAEEISAVQSSTVRAVVSVSRTAAQQLRLLIPSKKIVTIRQSTSLRESQTERQRIKTLTNSCDLLVLLLAALRYYKGVLRFIRAIHSVRGQMPNVRGVIVGVASEKPVRNLARRCNLDVSSRNGHFNVGAVLFAGPSNYPGSWIRESKVVVCASSSYEGVPGSLREAMLAGCPVVSTDVGYVRELIEHNRTGILVAKTSESLSRAVLRVLNGGRSIEAMTERARRRVENRFSLESRIHAHLDLYAWALE